MEGGVLRKNTYKIVDPNLKKQKTLYRTSKLAYYLKILIIDYSKINMIQNSILILTEKKRWSLIILLQINKEKNNWRDFTVNSRRSSLWRSKIYV